MSSIHPTMLSLGAGSRLAIVAGLIVLLWGAVLWAL